MIHEVRCDTEDNKTGKLFPKVTILFQDDSWGKDANN